MERDFFKHKYSRHYYFHKKPLVYFVLVLCVFFSGCGSGLTKPDSIGNNGGRFDTQKRFLSGLTSVFGGKSHEIDKKDFPGRNQIKPIIRGFRKALSTIEINMIKHGLVDIQQLDSTIVVDLKYSGTDNFLGKDVYGGMQRAYLQPDVAGMLVKSQQYLKQVKPAYSLIVFDAARPRSVQQKMWDIVDAPFAEKIKFLSNPANGSIHNFAAAVDVSILDEKGNLLDMGTGFDYMGELAYPILEKELLEQGRLKPSQIENRMLLRRVMRHGGFWGIQTEWWHFNACTRAEARERYNIIE